MPHRSATRMAWLGAGLGLALALLLFAPARWLGQALQWATQGQLQLVNARGTVWRGQADLLFTGGEGSRGQTALPQGVVWRLNPTLAGARPALTVQLSAPCCTPEPLSLTAVLGLRGAELRVAAFDSQWPADLLAGLGTPWNTLRLEGQLGLRSPGLKLLWSGSGTRFQGTLTVDALDVASRVSTLRPLGSYRLVLQSADEGRSATLALNTLRGELRLKGNGQWIAGRLRFQGEARAAPGREAALSNLLNILGRRDGPRSLLNIG